ncbi:MAG TPA: hypothetical protein VLV48_06740 [Thermoanaerobaculia bacterium]|nr:hypothetical protein [Thermoanaerobaculia bacterium]
MAGRKLHVIVTSAPAGEMDRDGGDSFYHEVVTDQRDRPMIGLLASVDPKISDVADSLVPTLRERGVDAVVSDSSVLPKLPDLEGMSLFDALRLTRATLEATRAGGEIEEFVLVLAIRHWGVRRPFVGIFPVGRHAAFFEIEASLVDRQNALVPLWSTVGTGLRPIEREWNEPPDFPKVREALALALDDAIQEMTRALFAEDGMLGPPGARRTGTIVSDSESEPFTRQP